MKIFHVTLYRGKELKMNLYFSTLNKAHDWLKSNNFEQSGPSGHTFRHKIGNKVDRFGYILQPHWDVFIYCPILDELPEIPIDLKVDLQIKNEQST